MKRPSPQNMNARLEYGAAASSMVRTKGIMYGQNETASVPNADRKIDMNHRKGQFIPAVSNTDREHNGGQQSRALFACTSERRYLCRNPTATGFRLPLKRRASAR